MGRLLTVKQVAALFNLAPITVYKLVARGRLPAIRVGRSYRFDSEQLFAHVGLQLTPEQRERFLEEVLDDGE